MQKMLVQSLSWEDSLECEMTAESSVLAWEIPRTEESGGMQFSSETSVMSWLFATLWTATHKASLSFIISWSLLKLISIEPVIPSNHLILCHPLFLPSISPSIRVFSNELLFTSGGQSIAASDSASVLSMNIQDWFPLGLTSLISLQSQRLTSLLQHHSSIASILWRSAFFTVQLSQPYMHDHWKNHSFD